MNTPPKPGGPAPSVAPLERSLRSLPAHTGPAVAVGGVAGAATGAALGSALGPIGLAVGAVGGAIAGGLAGKGVVETNSPTDEGQFWAEQHARQPYAAGLPYEALLEAYKVGYQYFGRAQAPFDFEIHEAELRREYEAKSGPGALPWEQARPAALAAWNRMAHHEDVLLGDTVEDVARTPVGTVSTLWHAENGRPVFAGVAASWLSGKVHGVPVQASDQQSQARVWRVPYAAALLREAPAVDPAADLSPEDQERICRHFGLTAASIHAEQMAPPPASGPARTS